jgi:Xaa-Pro aminopeptidase
MTARIGALGATLADPLLVTNATNVRYLTGFKSSNAAVLVSPGGGATLYTDFRYIELARSTVDIPVELVKRSLLKEVAAMLTGRVAFEADAVAYGDWELLAAGGADLVPSKGAVEALRAIKDDEEIAAIARAARVADRAFEALTAETWVGRTEKELAWRLRELLHAHGADDLAFDTIVASGPHGALPHAVPGDLLIEPRTLVTVDWGARLDGYCSDCTRTVATGQLSGQLREIYDVCLDAQEQALAGIHAGITGVSADSLARNPIEAAGYGGAFGHGLGHGVGMAVHEAPRLALESSDTLETGQIVTVEPGIYLEGVGGVRIEDLAVVRDGGLELLTSFPKTLITVS